MPRLNFLTAESEPISPEAPAEAFGSGAGQRALGEALDQVSGLGERLLDAEFSMRAQHSIAQAGRELQELQLSTATLPIEEQQRAVRSKRAEILARHRKPLGRSKYAELYDLRAGLLADESELNLHQEANRRRIDQSRADWMATLDEHERAAKNAPTREGMLARLEAAREATAEAKAKGVLSPSQAERALQGLKDFEERETLVEEVQHETDRIVGSFADPKAREAEARKLRGPLRDEVLQRIEHHNDRERAQEQRDDQERWDRTVNGILDSTITSIDQIQAQGLDGDDTVRAISILRSQTLGADVVTDLDYYEMLSELAGAADKTAFFAEKLDKTQLSRSDYAQMVDLRRRMLSAQHKPLDLERIDAAIRRAADAQRWDRGERGRDAEKFREFHRAVRAGFAQLGPQATESQLEELIDEQLMEVVVRPTRLFGLSTGLSERRARFKIGPKTRVEVPDEHVERILGSLARVGKEPTEENIQDAYRRGLAAGIFP